MAARLFKVWTPTEKKMVLASSLEEVVTLGKRKLSINEDNNVTVHLEDGTEVDDDDVLQALQANTVLYLLQENDIKPWGVTSQVIDLSLLSTTSSDVSLDLSSASLQTLESTTDTDSTSEVSPRILQHWPDKFQLPVSFFSSELSEGLTSGNLSWRCKSELLNHIAREISKYTLQPSARQRDEVAKLLISSYPKLKSNIGEGHHGWAVKIYDKMNEESKRRRRPVIKRAYTSKVKQVKLPRRGEINFSFQEQEHISEDIKYSQEFLSKEFGKPLSERDNIAVANCLGITLSNRRSLVSQKCLVKDIIKEYPMFFNEEVILHDFRHINGFDLEARFLERLEICSAKVVEEACSIKKKSSVIAKIIEDDINPNITALRLLPYLLGDKNADAMYKFFPFETNISDIEFLGPETPRVIVLGDINDTTLCYILVENMSVISVNGFIKAIMLMFSVYYCCNMQYAFDCVRSLKFIQTYILQMPEATKLPAKLLTFCAKMP